MNPYIQSILPAALQETKSSEIESGTRVPKILDIGCGFAPMALALKILISSTGHLRGAPQPVESEEENTGSIKYVGIDIRSDAISWLKQAYSHDKDFYFHHHLSSANVDYIGNFKGSNKQTAGTAFSSDGSECLFSIPFSYNADIQWSSSLFTHLTPSAVENTLSFIRQHLAGGCIYKYMANS